MSAITAPPHRTVLKALTGLLLALFVSTLSSTVVATGTVFAISAGVALLGVVAALLLKPVSLRASLDLSQEK